jgi:hypothetical protein
VLEEGIEPTWLILIYQILRGIEPQSITLLPKLKHKKGLFDNKPSWKRRSKVGKNASELVIK